jgi:Asp-tRNA(Asn)/Glu-tRNA(Gln) amidotransferase C subunit
VYSKSPTDDNQKDNAAAHLESIIKMLAEIRLLDCSGALPVYSYKQLFRTQLGRKGQLESISLENYA